MKVVHYTWILGAALLMNGCGSEDNSVEGKRAKLNEYKKQVSELRVKISDLESELALLDTAFAAENRKAVLISTVPVKRATFTHFVEVSGTVESKTNITVSPEMSGIYKQILVRDGDFVKSGQVLAKLDNEMVQNQIAELQTALELATTLLEKRERLWKQKIGSEVQYLEARTNKISLERSIATLTTQLSKSAVNAPISGQVEEVYARTGELAQPGIPLLRIVSTADAYVKADVPETYLNKFRAGDYVQLSFPATGKKFDSRIRAVGTLINPANRTYEVEVALPADPTLTKPGLMSVLNIKDQELQNAIQVPSYLIQRDLQSEFVYVVDAKSAIPMARKARIERGISYQNLTVIESGLVGNELLVDEGFREVVDGAKVRVLDETSKPSQPEQPATVQSADKPAASTPTAPSPQPAAKPQPTAKP